jgi:hypothetical protein
MIISENLIVDEDIPAWTMTSTRQKSMILWLTASN